MSTMKVMTTAPARVPLRRMYGNGAIAIPKLAMIEAINRSTIDESANQTLGR